MPLLVNTFFGKKQKIFKFVCIFMQRLPAESSRCRRKSRERFSSQPHSCRAFPGEVSRPNPFMQSIPGKVRSKTGHPAFHFGGLPFGQPPMLLFQKREKPRAPRGASIHHRALHGKICPRLDLLLESFAVYWETPIPLNPKSGTSGRKTGERFAPVRAGSGQVAGDFFEALRIALKWKPVGKKERPVLQKER